MSKATTKSYQLGGLSSESDSTEDEDVGTAGYNKTSVKKR